MFHSWQSRRRKCKLPRRPTPLSPYILCNRRNLMTSLEIHPNLRTRAIHPADAINLRSRDTVRVEVSLGPGLAVVHHFTHGIRSIVKDPNSDGFRAGHVTSASYRRPGLDLRELGTSTIPATFAVVALFYYAMLNMLEIHTINSFSTSPWNRFRR